LKVKQRPTGESTQKGGRNRSIQVGNRVIETDVEGYQINPGDWSDEVAAATAAIACEAGSLLIRRVT
jgi:hypothetical protein